MNESFSVEATSGLPGGRDRAAAVEAASLASLPTAESEDWRYSPIGDLESSGWRPVSAPPDDVEIDLFDDIIEHRSATVTVIDGFVTSVDVDPGYAAKGLVVEIVADVAPLELDLAEPTVFDHLHRAFSPAAIRIATPAGLVVEEPVVVVTHAAASESVSFPHLIIESGEGSDISVVERQTSTTAAALSIPVTELTTGAASQLRYVVIQENGTSHWQIGRQLSTIGAQSTLSSGMAVFGSRYARTRTDSRILGRGATANLVAAYYGDNDQVHDFRTFQHHEARDTRSDLLFKGSQDDRSGSIYTGLIHIHPEGANTNAFQTNRNVKLSEDAWAWSVPNLEIENNDVHCSHASTVSPVDGDQRFYLHARGVPPSVADRLIVAGFFDEAIQRLPVVAARAEVQRLVDEKLDRRNEHR